MQGFLHKRLLLCMAEVIKLQLEDVLLTGVEPQRISDEG